MHKSRRDFFPTSRKAINEIKIHYLHLNSIITCNLLFGCFLIFSIHSSIKLPPINVLEGRDGSNFSSHTSLGNPDKKMRCELLEGSEKPPAGEMPATTNYSVPLPNFCAISLFVSQKPANTAVSLLNFHNFCTF